MARYERRITGELDAFTAYLNGAVRKGSVTATLEDSSDQAVGDARMVVLVYERFSALGGNRVSLNISLLAAKDQPEIALTAIASGGSEAMFFKVNSFGEEAFLDKIIKAIEAYQPGQPAG
jgi:hypothetical protein